MKLRDPAGEGSGNKEENLNRQQFGQSYTQGDPKEDPKEERMNAAVDGAICHQESIYPLKGISPQGYHLPCSYTN